MISTVTHLGTLRFMIYEGALNAALFPIFLRRLIKHAHCKVFLIVDNLRVYRAKLVTAWVTANRDRIELFYLPPPLYVATCLAGDNISLKQQGKR